MAKTKEKLGNIKTVSLEDLAPTFRETGCVPMDLALTNGKGMPVGASILMYAPAGVGKTTIFADMCRNLLESSLAKGEEYKIVYVDVEGSRNLLLSMGLGKYMISGNLILKEGAITFAQLEDIYAKILAWHELDSEDSKNSKKLDPEYKDVKLIIVDSLSQVQSQALMEKGVDDGDFGSNAKERSRFYPKYFARCKACGVTNMYIAQMRVNVNAVGMFDPKEKPAVSTSDLFNYDIIIKASKSENNQNKDIAKISVQTAFGKTELQNRCIVTLKSSRGKDVKNRYCTLPDMPLMVEYGKRVVNSYTLREMLIGLGFVIDKGSGYYSITADLAEGLGLDMDLDKSYRKKDINVMVSQNIDKILLYLKSKDKYKLLVEDANYDDGL